MIRRQTYNDHGYVGDTCSTYTADRSKDVQLDWSLGERAEEVAQS